MKNFYLGYVIKYVEKFSKKNCLKDFEVTDSFKTLDLKDTSSPDCIDNIFTSRFISKRLNILRSSGNLLKCEYETAAPERMKVLNSDIRNIPAAKNACIANTARVPKSFPHKISRPPEERRKYITKVYNHKYDLVLGLRQCRLLSIIRFYLYSKKVKQCSTNL